MCGIAGILNRNPQTDSLQLVKNATGCLSHRGPDSEGYWSNIENTVALGHRRLKIIDLSEKASQPMHYMDRYILVYNGEIYNFIELRNQLQLKGYQFTTQSDAEVLIAAYDAYGNNCVQYFDGMFAFAIWDKIEQQLFIARDRFGEKPLFFYYDEKRLIFASEIRSIWKLGVEKEVNRAMLYNFLSIGYTTNPTDPQETFYKNIHKLPAASHLVYSSVSHQLILEKYWEVFPAINTSINESQAVEQFIHLFSGSVKKRLRSDVPIGTSLSGGIDSSAIISFCDREAPANYSHKCFTASFPGFDKNEMEFASLVARQFNLEHHVVEIKEDEITGLMNRVMKYQEEPISSSSMLAQYKVYEAAKQNGVTVLLDGQGADEFLAGYHKYYKWYWLELYRQGQLSKSGELLSAKLLNGNKQSFSAREKIAALLPDLAAAVSQSQKARKASHDPDLDRDFAFNHKRDFYYATPASFDLNGALYYNTFVHGLEELLRFADRNSMANSTEVRLPFLNHELVTFLFSLPPHFKIHNGWTKWVLRKSVQNLLPPEIVWRKEKIGFEPPQKQWMQNKEIQEAIQQAKRKLADEGILSKAAVHKKIKPHDAHAADNRDWKYWSAAFLF